LIVFIIGNSTTRPHGVIILSVEEDTLTTSTSPRARGKVGLSAVLILLMLAKLMT
jgi:hypothetical protein